MIYTFYSCIMHKPSKYLNMYIVEIVVLYTGQWWSSSPGQCWNWPKRTEGSDAEVFEIMHRDWIRGLKPIFT